MHSFNTKYFPLYRSLISMMAWLPVFFLYFNAHLDIKQVILLEAIYYSAVVVLEVPSGFFSDIFGRKRTLLISAIFFSLSYAIFGFAAPEFLYLTGAQICLAVGMSFMSGSDTSFYYESLQEINREKEFPELEAKVQSYQQYAGSFAVLLGGFLGALELHFAYVASFFFMLPAVVLTVMFTEPRGEKVVHEMARERRVLDVASYLRVPELRWMFVYSVIIYVLSHITYEFYQPYLELLHLESLDMNTAISSGILFAIARVLGAYAAGQSARWVRHYGLRNVSIAALLLQLVIIGFLGLMLHPVLILLIIMRSFSMALTTAPVNAEVAPRVQRQHRASYFSLQSLASRLAYSLTLLSLTMVVSSGTHNEWLSVSRIFIYSFVIGLIASVLLYFIGSGSLFHKKDSKRHQSTIP